MPTYPATELANWRDVESSNVARVGWAKKSNVMLVRYRSGDVYAYLGVSRQRAVAAVRAPSVGGYINRVIKPSFPCARIG